MKAFDWIKRLLVAKPAGSAKRAYAGGRNTRFTVGFSAPHTSADTELQSSLANLRARSRALCRDVVYAKRAKAVVINNVIGAGIGIQANVSSSRATLRKPLNDKIESAWADWSQAKNCHTGGGLHFADFERAVMSEVFVSGEAFIRKHYRAFGDSSVPLALELIEAERIADEYEVPQPLDPGSMMRLGIEVDLFNRPVAYWVKEIHPNELRTKIDGRTAKLVRIPADQMFHLRLIERWPQTRGEPWLHAAIMRLNQLGEFEDAAVIAARIGASKVGFFENPEGDIGIADGEEANGTPNMTVEAGEFTQLPPGYKFNSWDPNYPNDVFEPFVRAALRGIAAGVGVSYESLSRDYSQSNYSSSRLALIDDRDLWRTLQQWYIRNFRQPLHAEWLQLATLAGAVPIRPDEFILNKARYEAVRFKPRGWSWVDPTKEVNAYKEAVRCGFTTVSDVINATGNGMDLEDVLEQRRAELDMMEEADLVFDTDPEFQEGAAPAAAEPAEPEDQAEPEDDAPTDQPDTPEDGEDPPARLYAFKRDQP